MGLENVKSYLANFGLADRVIEFQISSATVALAAQALGCEEKLIAKTMAFDIHGENVLVVMAGDAKTDNRKFKDFFKCKAVMIHPDELPERIGHPMGGVCAFDIKSDVKTYLDNSLLRFETIYPAAGTPNSAVRLTPKELEEAVQNFAGWTDVSKIPEEV